MPSQHRISIDGLGYSGGFQYDSTLALWVRGDDCTADSSNAVSAMTGLVPGLTYSQSTTAAKPLRVLNALNGHAVLDFNGTSHYMTTGAVTISTPMHHFFVVKLRDNTDTGPHRLFDQTVTTAPTALIFPGYSSIYGNMNDARPWPTLSSLPASTWMILDYAVTATASKLARNGGTPAVGGAYSGTMNGILLGAHASLGAYFGCFQLAEHLMFSAEKTGTARAQVCANLAATYGLQLAA